MDIFVTVLFAKFRGYLNNSSPTFKSIVSSLYLLKALSSLLTTKIDKHAENQYYENSSIHDLDLSITAP